MRRLGGGTSEVVTTAGFFVTFGSAIPLALTFSVNAVGSNRDFAVASADACSMAMLLSPNRQNKLSNDSALKEKR